MKNLEWNSGVSWCVGIFVFLVALGVGMKFDAIYWAAICSGAVITTLCAASK